MLTKFQSGTKTTPSIIMWSDLEMPGMVAGRGVFLGWYDGVKSISEDFDTLRLRLLDAAHSLTCCSSWGSGMRCEFTEGTNK